MVKKKSKKKPVKLSDVALEETESLLAIYGEEYFALDVDEETGLYLGCTLRVVPNLDGENLCFAELQVTYLQGYPMAPLQIYLEPGGELPVGDVKRLVHELQDMAACAATEGRICIFDLATRVHDVVAETNDRICTERQENMRMELEKASPHPPPTPHHRSSDPYADLDSLRAADLGVDLHEGWGGGVGRDAGLFDDDDLELDEGAAPQKGGRPPAPPKGVPIPPNKGKNSLQKPPYSLSPTLAASSPSAALSRDLAGAAPIPIPAAPPASRFALDGGAQTATATATGASPAKERRHGVHRGPLADAALVVGSPEITMSQGPGLVRRISSTLSRIAATIVPPRLLELLEGPAHPTHHPIASGPGPSRLSQEAKRALTPATIVPGPPATPGGATPAPTTQLPIAAARGTSALLPVPSGSRKQPGGSVLVAPGSALPAPGAPPPLSSPHPASSSATLSPPEASIDDSIRKDVLVGYLLLMATSGRGAGTLPSRVLPALSSALLKRGLIPEWVGHLVTRRPDLFGKAFQRLYGDFSREIPLLVSGGQVDPSCRWALEKFWGGRAPGGGQGGAGDAGPSSRYMSDFEEIERLGKGGYGVVVGAINRLDGRKYAIKKIKLGTDFDYDSRILREVSTLSRLQHPNIVRYYQAWVEQAAPGTASTEGSEEDEDGTLSDSQTGDDSDASGSTSSDAPRRTGKKGKAAASAATSHPSVSIPRPLREGREGSGMSGLGEKDGDSSESGTGLGRGGTESDTEGDSVLGSSGSDSASRDGSDSGSDSETSSSSERGHGRGARGSAARPGGIRSLFRRQSLSSSEDDSGEGSSDGAESSGETSSGEDEDEEEESEEEEGEEGGRVSRGKGAGLRVPTAAPGRPVAQRGEQGKASGEWDSLGPYVVFGDRSLSGAAGPGLARPALRARLADEEPGTSEISASAAEGEATSTGGPSARPGPPDRGHTTRGSRPPGTGALRHVLYIQMEYCPVTLRQVLDSPDPPDAESAYEVLRQILEGLAHIHAQGMIHRDLKPANIFKDARGDIKLGDFGLAKFRAAQGDDPEPAAPSGPSEAGAAGPGRDGTGIRAPSRRDGPSHPAAVDQTGLVGTFFYIAPEISEGWSSYDEKVDLFSLGIIVFELFHPFGTGMERAFMLRRLREVGELPAKFRRDLPQVAKLIDWLTQPSPAVRPTAMEVLQSDMLPRRLRDEQLSDLLRSLPDDPPAYTRVINSVMEMGMTRTEAAAGTSSVAAEELPGTPKVTGERGGTDPLILDQLVSAARQVFAVHGAVRMSSQAIGYATLDVPEDAAVFLSSSGATIALRYDCRYPFALWVARQGRSDPAPAGLDSLRRYETAWVRRKGVGRGLPREFLQVDLDFLNPAPGGRASPRDSAINDAEVIRAVGHVLEAAEAASRAGGGAGWSCEFRVSHRGLREWCAAALGVGRDRWPSLARLLRPTLSRSPLDCKGREAMWPPVQKGLEGLGLTPAAIAAVRQLLIGVPGEAEGALARLAQLAQQMTAGPSGPMPGAAPPSVPGATLLQLALDDLNCFAEYCAHWEVPTSQLVLDPLMPQIEPYYSGTHFQVYLAPPPAGGWVRVAAGGRYDGLLRTLWGPSPGDGGSGAPGGVGVSINTDKVVQFAARRAARGPAAAAAATPTIRTSQAEVMVCARGGGVRMVKARIELVKTLRAEGLKVEMVPLANPSMEEQMAQAKAKGVRYLVTLDPDSLSTGNKVRVKTLERKAAETVISADGVGRFLREQLHGAAGRGLAAGGLGGQGAGGAGGGGGLSSMLGPGGSRPVPMLGPTGSRLGPGLAVARVGGDAGDGPRGGLGGALQGNPTTLSGSYEGMRGGAYLLEHYEGGGAGGDGGGAGESARDDRERQRRRGKERGGKRANRARERDRHLHHRGDDRYLD